MLPFPDLSAAKLHEIGGVCCDDFLFDVVRLFLTAVVLIIIILLLTHVFKVFQFRSDKRTKPHREDTLTYRH